MAQDPSYVWGGEGGYHNTEEVKIALVPVPAFTSSKLMASSNLQIQEEQLFGRLELAQIVTDQSLKQTKGKQKAKGPFDVRKVPLYDPIL